MPAATSSKVAGSPPPLPTRRYSRFHAVQPASGQVRGERARRGRVVRGLPEAAVDHDDDAAGVAVGSVEVRPLRRVVAVGEPLRVVHAVSSSGLSAQPASIPRPRPDQEAAGSTAAARARHVGTGAQSNRPCRPRLVSPRRRLPVEPPFLRRPGGPGRPARAAAAARRPPAAAGAEALAGGLPVGELGAVLLRDDGDHAVHQSGARAARSIRSRRWFGTDGDRGEVEGQLDAAVGGVHALPAGTRGAGEALASSASGTANARVTTRSSTVAPRRQTRSRKRSKTRAPNSSASTGHPLVDAVEERGEVEVGRAAAAARSRSSRCRAWPSACRRCRRA